MQKRDVIIDCDTGVDDAMALLLALRSPVFNVLGITTVAGNTTIEKATRNTLVVVEHSGRKAPVLQGAFRPLAGPLRTAEYAHGSDGLGDIGFPDPQESADEEHAVDFLARTIMESTQPVDLITLAPLTNIALALLKEPKLEERVHSLVMMAGGLDGGNTTPAAEFNVWVDPEAADMIFSSRIPKTMVALDPIRQGGGIESEDVEQFERTDTPWCWLAGQLLRMRLNRWKQLTGQQVPTHPPDLAAMGIAIDRTIATSQMYSVAIETQGKHTRGMTVVDSRPYRHLFRDPPEPNCDVVTSIDNQRYRRLVLDTFCGNSDIVSPTD
jgi:inosine-uridine nucleoside N-ribohydrolase